MRSRDCAGCRTHRLVAPEGVTFEDRADHVVVAAPGLPGSPFDFRLELDHPPAPDALGAWFARWDERFAGLDLSRATLVWETRGPEPLDVPPGTTLVPMRVLLFDRVEDPPRLPGTREATPADRDALAALQVATLGRDDARVRRWARWRVDALLDRATTGWGTTFVHEAEGEVVGMCGVAWDAREARLQLVSVREDHRRRGVAAGLVRSAVAAYQEVSAGITYVLCDAGSPGEAVVRSVGARRATYFWRCHRPR